MRRENPLGFKHRKSSEHVLKQKALRLSHKVPSLLLGVQSLMSGEPVTPASHSHPLTVAPIMCPHHSHSYKEHFKKQT